jgi:acetylornithine deacetylase/succinyl-diaminopimelate desuccinylase family protein
VSHLAFDVISLLAELVRIPSVCGNEDLIADFTAEWLRERGLPAELLEVKPKRPDVICRLKGQRPGPHLLFNAHMDTVAAGEGWVHNPFGAEIENGKMFGRGTIDMKSGLASMLVAVADCTEEGLPKRGEITLTAVVDEESLDLGTYALVQEGVINGVDLALISEATNLNVVTAHRGRTVLEVTVHGKAAHSMWPQNGVNAIQEAAVLISNLPKLNSPTHPRMGRSTTNVLKIEGGQEDVMLVPDTCRIIIDRCLVPGHSSREALDDLNRLIKEIRVDANAKFIDRETPFCDPFQIPDEDEHVRTVVEAAKRALGKVPDIQFHEGPCDSCILVNQGGVPTLEFGPSGGKLHEPEEFVELESVKKTTEVYKEIIRTLLS